MSALRKLIEAVEAGKPNKNDGTLYRLFGDDWVHVWDVIDRGSLDAAKALHEALLPGWAWVIADKRSACVSPPDAIRPEGILGEVGKSEGNPARAWLISILKAYEAQQGDTA